MAAFKGLIAAAFLFEADAQDQSNDIEQHVDSTTSTLHKNEDLCMMSFMAKNSEGSTDTGGMQLCKCDGCQANDHSEESSTWQLGDSGKEMISTNLTQEMCVVRQQQPSGEEILAAFPTDQANFLGFGSGCVANMIDEEGHWWGDETKQKCV